ncbi:hypothetical protein ACWD4T_28675, partial [Streptomyces umbrinus]
AALAVTAQADHDPDSARALVRISEDRYTGFNRLLERAEPLSASGEAIGDGHGRACCDFPLHHACVRQFRLSTPPWRPSRPTTR